MGGLLSQRGLLRPEKPDEEVKEAKGALRRLLEVPVSFSEKGQRARLNALSVFLVYQRGAARGETNVIFQHVAVSTIGINFAARGALRALFPERASHKISTARRGDAQELSQARVSSRRKFFPIEKSQR